MDRLDALIESTMALAKDVKPQSISDLAPVVRTAEQALADTSKPIPAATTMFAIVSEHVFPFLRNMAEAGYRVARSRWSWEPAAKKIVDALFPGFSAAMVDRGAK